MGITIIVGGQFGSEGKGKVAHWYANKVDASAVVRVGGINSGHTVVDEQSNISIFRILPTAAIDNSRKCVLPAGSYIDIALLQEEIVQSRINPENILIDPKAVIITNEHILSERGSNLSAVIGSTSSGTGAAVSMRVNRVPNLLFAKDVPTLSSFICNTAEYLCGELRAGKEIVIEGTQGFGLSNIHTPYYPYATSRDTTAAGFLSEAGLSPLDVTNIVMVIRSYPIRVGGNSGPLPAETSWDDVSLRAGRGSTIREYTSVTKHLRRVANFDSEIVKSAIVANRPNVIVLNHLDYINEPTDEIIGPARRKFVESVESQIGQKIDYVGLDNRSVLHF